MTARLKALLFQSIPGLMARSYEWALTAVLRGAVEGVEGIAVELVVSG